MAPLALTRREMDDVLLHKYGQPDAQGWGPRLRADFGYYTPDDLYEALIARLVTPATAWLDVGCGRDLFPSNPHLSRQLSWRCALLVGVDPSDNIHENPFIHRRVQCAIEDFSGDVPFDLITMRMVAEHVPDPAPIVDVLRKNTKPGGRVVIYTVNKWSLITAASVLIPFRIHHPIKRVLWGTQEQDTFPVAYRMNTRRALRRAMAAGEFVEETFTLLDDCRTFAKWKSLNTLELCVWKIAATLRVPYPETCLLGIYRRAV